MTRSTVSAHETCLPMVGSFGYDEIASRETEPTRTVYMTAPAAMNPRQFNFGSYLFTLQWNDTSASPGDWEYPR
jgi:hypothetical protein